MAGEPAHANGGAKPAFSVDNFVQNFGGFMDFAYSGTEIEA